MVSSAAAADWLGMTRQPWLDYNGESTQQLLDYAGTFRTDSLVCAFEQGIQAKERLGAALTTEETVVLAVETLEREVNNGGFHQFFTNSSHRYAPVIVDSLNRIAAHNVAALCTEALAALRLSGEITPESVKEAAERASDEDDDEVLQALDRLDQRFYTIGDIADELLAFVRANAAAIRV